MTEETPEGSVISEFPITPEVAGIPCPTIGEISRPADNDLTGKEEIEKIREKNRHEEEMARYGLFGKLFGTESNSSKNITFSILIIILVLIFTLSVLSPMANLDKNFIKEMFDIYIPLVTLAFGYFFGKQN